MKLVKESLYEKFTEDGDPVKDLGIGGYTYETLTPGAIIRPKRFVVIGRKSGHIVSRDKGQRLYPTYYLLILTTYNMTARDRYFTYLMYNSLEYAQKNRETFDLLTPNYVYNVVNKGKLYLKKQSFNNRFEIVERGF